MTQQKINRKNRVLPACVICHFVVDYARIIMATQLEQLKKFTTVVADTGDFRQMEEFAPQDATTNPSLILAAAAKPEYRPILDAVVADFKATTANPADKIGELMDRVIVAFGLEILKRVPGRVSSEVDARL